MVDIRHETTVACDRHAAFDLFARAMGTWWDPRYTPDADTFTDVLLEPVVGGIVVMQHGAATYPFGEVVVWEESAHYAQTFWLAMDPAHPTRIDARFEDVAGARGVCTLSFTHGGWTEDNAAYRHKYTDWPHLLGRFAEAAARV